MVTKKKDEGKTEADLEGLNEFLAEETADGDDIGEVERMVENLTTTTKLLSALAELYSVDFEDEVGATLLREFRVKFAKHEMETL